MTRSDLADIAMTWSALKEMSRSPAHCRHKALQPDAGEQSLAMRMGSGVHALTFGTPPVEVWRSRRAGKAWEAFESDCAVAGVLVLNDREYTAASAIAGALQADPIAAPLLFHPSVEVEQPMEWTVAGRAYRTRGVDFRSRERGYIGELKVARTCQPAAFLRDQLRTLYPAQVVLYDEGDAILTGRDPERDPFNKYIIAVEPTPPYVVTVFRLEPSAVRDAKKKIGLYRSILATCEASNSWPGYSLSVVPLEVEELAWDSVDEDELADDAGPMESATWTSNDTDDQGAL